MCSKRVDINLIKKLFEWTNITFAKQESTHLNKPLVLIELWLVKGYKITKNHPNLELKINLSSIGRPLKSHDLSFQTQTRV